MKNFLILLLFPILLLNCSQSKVQTDNTTELKKSAEINEDEISEETVIKEQKLINPEKLTSAYFASGCFWCVEAIYESIRGVQEVYNGYSGGHTKNPTYESSNTGKTGHAEAVEVIYDSSIVSFKELVDVYYGSQNIEQVNGQGYDMGSQYRSIIFYSDESEKEIIDSKITQLKSTGLKPAAEVKQFEKLHPNQRYIVSVSIPRLNRFKKKFPELLKAGK